MRLVGLLILHLVEYALYWKTMDSLCARKRRWDWLAVILSLILAILACVNASMGSKSLFSNGIALMNAIFLGMGSCRYFQAKRRHMIAISIFFFSAIYLIDFAGVLILGIVLRMPTISNVLLIESGLRRLLYYGLLRGVECFLCLHLTKEKHTTVYKIMTQKTVTLYVLAIALFWAMSTLLVVRSDGATIEILQYASVWVVIAIALSVVFVLYQMYLRLKMVEKEDKMKLQLLLGNFQQLEAEQTSRARVMHEIKHYVHAIQIMLEENRHEDAKKYLTEIVGQVQKESSEHWCENPTVNAILNLKVAEAKGKDIDVRTDINVFPCKIDEVDFCILIANLMENAIEATELAEEPWLHIIVEEENGKTKMCIRNSYSKMPIETENGLQTTKEDTAGHGVGLQNVRAVIEKNKGFIMYTYNEKWFEIVVAV